MRYIGWNKYLSFESTAQTPYVIIPTRMFHMSSAIKTVTALFQQLLLIQKISKHTISQTGWRDMFGMDAMYHTGIRYIRQALDGKYSVCMRQHCAKDAIYVGKIHKQKVLISHSNLTKNFISTLFEHLTST